MSAIPSEGEPLTPGVIARMAEIDVETASDDDVVALMAAWARVKTYAEGQIARAVLTLRERVSPGEAFDADELVSAEVAAALHLGTGGADRLVATAAVLASRFPATLDAVRAGAVSWAKATTLVEQTAVLDDAAARLVEERVLPAAAGRTPAQHADAVRRAVDRVDTASADERRRRALADIELIRQHVGDGMGELFARMTSEQLDTVWLGADAWARRQKAAGDGRTLGQLRVAALVQWAQDFLATAAPRRHGRAVRLTVLWDLTSVLGLTDHCGELADSGATLPPSAVRELLAGGAGLRRMLIDPDTGELVDLSSRRVALPPVDPGQSTQPVDLNIVVTTDQLRSMRSGEDAAVSSALELAPPDLREMLLAPITADDLDSAPASYPARSALAEFVGMRDRHPTNPGAGLCAARAGDIDHVVSVRNGGRTVRDNLHSPTRRWHRLRTHGGWTVVRTGRGWRWTSWTGRSVTTGPYDYRLGP